MSYDRSIDCLTVAWARILGAEREIRLAIDVARDGGEFGLAEVLLDLLGDTQTLRSRINRLVRTERDAA